MITIGDIFNIPLSNGNFAFGQYVFRDNMGPIIQISKQIGSNPTCNGKYSFSKLLFPPVITGLYAAIRKKMWKIIDRSAITDFQYPGFVSTYYDYNTGRAGNWFYWDGVRFTQLGENLPDKYKTCEYLVVWSPHDIVNRIETGESPYPYTDLIMRNSFVPKK